jgi:hypothetical protein
MTCIVGLVHGDKVYLGADSAAATSDYSIDNVLDIRKAPKTFKISEFGFAYTTSFRMGDLLHYSFKPPKYRKKKMSIDEYMRTIFIDKVRKTFKDGGFGSLDPYDDGERGGTFLVGFKGRLFHVGGNFQIGESANGYSAEGAGAAFALGSLASTSNREPKDRVMMALEAAEKFSPFVRPPFTIIEI